MLISGIQPFTLLDYPHKVSCVIFTPGCNFRCGYCHNPEFVLPEHIIQLKRSFIPEKTFYRFLEKRQSLLDGVVISGGEPTMAVGLLDCMRNIKSRGFLVKLDTNGNQPSVIQQVISENLVDYIAMDVKTSIAEYTSLVLNCVIPNHIIESIQLIKDSGISYEFRSTLIKEIHREKTLEDMRELLVGADMMYIQTFRPTTTLDPKFAQYHPFSNDEMQSIAHKFREVVREVVIR